MPSKRDLLGDDTPFDGLDWSEFRWNRILAFFGGISTLVFYLWIDLYQYLPDWVAAILVSIPVGLLYFGVTEQSWQTSIKISIGAGVGIALSTHLDSIGIHLFQ